MKLSISRSPILRPLSYRPILCGAITSLLLLPGSLHAITELDLLPWGPSAGDIKTMNGNLATDGTGTQEVNGGNDDGYTTPISFLNSGPDGASNAINFFGSSFTSLYVNNNGLISFGAGDPAYTTQSFPIAGGKPVIAGYWGDVDTRGAAASGQPLVGQTSGLVWYRTVTEGAQLSSVGAMINAGFGGAVVSGGQQTAPVSFAPTVMQVVTWDHVGSYSLSSSTRNQTSLTFQMIVASDGVQTYSLFLYPQGEQQWLAGDATPNTFPQIGFDAGDGTHFFNVSGTQTSATEKMWATSNTLTPQPGVTVVRIDQNAGGAPTANWAGGTGTWANGLGGSNWNFGGTAGTVTLSAPAIASTLNVTTNGYTFTSVATANSLQFNSLALPSGGNVNFGGSLVVQTNPSFTGAISQGNLNFTDNSILVARGTGAVNGGALHLAKSAQVQIYSPGATTSAASLSFDNSQGGNGGTLDLHGNSTALGALSSVAAGSGVITNSGTTPSTLTVAFDSATSTFSGLIQDGLSGVSLVKSGTGTLTLAGANTHTGTTTINAGALNLAHQNALQNSTAVLAGGALTFDAAGTAYTLGGLSGTGNLTLANNAASPQPVALTVGGNGATTTYSGNIGGAGSLTKSGIGSLTLSGTNSYSGVTHVTGGTLQLSRAAALYNSTSATLNPAVTAANFTVQTGAAAAFNTGGTGEFTPSEITNLAALGSFQSNAILGVDTTNAGSAVSFTAPLLTSAGNTTALSLNKLGTGTMALGADNVLNANWKVIASNGTLDTGSFNQTIAGLQLAGGNINGTTGTLTSNTAYDLRSGSIGARLAGSVALNKTTAGTATLSGVNNYTGVTTISAGTLQFANPTALYNSTTSALSASVTGSNLVVPGGSTAAFNIGGAGEFSPAEIATLAGLSGFQSGSSLGLDTSNATGSILFTTPLVSPNSGATALGLTKLGTGTLTLGANNVIGSSFTVAVPSGTLDLSTFNQTVAGVQLTGGTIGGSSGVLTSTTAFDLRSGTVSGKLGGTAGLTKTTTGTVILSGSNTFTGGVNLNAGVLQLGNAGALGSNTINFNGGTLQFSAGITPDLSSHFSGNVRLETNGQDVTLASSITSSSFTKLGAGTLTTNGALNAASATNGAGNVTVLGGTLMVKGGINGTANSAFYSDIIVGDGINPATLAGTGTIKPGVSGAVVIKSGATLAPGNGGGFTLAPDSNSGSDSNAALDLQSGATLHLSIANQQFATHGAPGANDYSKLTLQTFSQGQDPTLGATMTTTGLLDLSISGTVNNGDVFPIITTANAIAGLFSNTTGVKVGGSTYLFQSEGTYWEINYAWSGTTPIAGESAAAFQSVNSGTNVALLAVPEPGSLATLLAGGALLLGWRRRRRF